MWLLAKLMEKSPEEELEEQKQFLADELRKYLSQHIGRKNTPELRDQIKNNAMAVISEHFERQFSHVSDFLRPRLGEVTLQPDGRITASIILPRPTSFQHLDFTTSQERMEKELQEIISRTPGVDWDWG